MNLRERVSAPRQPCHALDGTRPLDSLASLLERGRDRQGNMDVKKRSQRRKSYKLAEDESPHLLGIQNKLGKVLPTEEDVVEAASLGKELKSRIRAEARKTHTTILDMLCLWDLNEDGTVTMKELHQAIVLIGLTEVTAPSSSEVNRFEPVATAPVFAVSTTSPRPGVPSAAAATTT